MLDYRDCNRIDRQKIQAKEVQHGLKVSKAEHACYNRKQNHHHGLGHTLNKIQNICACTIIPEENSSVSGKCHSNKNKATCFYMMHQNIYFWWRFPKFYNLKQYTIKRVYKYRIWVGLLNVRSSYGSFQLNVKCIYLWIKLQHYELIVFMTSLIRIWVDIWAQMLNSIPFI